MTDLQMRLTFQEEAIEQISRTLVAHQDRLEQLIREVTHLQEMVREIQPSPVGEGCDEPPPPHY